MMSEDEKMIAKLQWLTDRSRRDFKGNPPPFEKDKSRQTVEADKKRKDSQMASDDKFVPFWHLQVPLAQDAVPLGHLSGCSYDKFTNSRSRQACGGVSQCLIWDASCGADSACTGRRRVAQATHASNNRTDSYSMNCMSPSERAAAYRSLMLKHPKVRPESVVIHQDRWQLGTQLSGVLLVH